jgi:hypothetical protein
MAGIIGKSRSAYINKETGQSEFRCDEMVSISDYINARAKAEGDRLVTIDQLFSAYPIAKTQS